ncbi:hypothetical protein [Thalassobacillus pellis]|uniref:hypothetical protein n=1 Tax=Thalassobacillus pellis TaxID=748008 RepID=UPI00195FE2B8|nr:hypothetical protein [Thalassobacillus pellis]MBM7551476.1 hypothetical protein [Thalassobacillus pellis]
MAKGNKKYDYNLDQVKQLLDETDKNYRQIAAETGCPYSNVVYHGRKIRGKRYKTGVREAYTSATSNVVSEDKQKTLLIDPSNSNPKDSTESESSSSFQITNANIPIEDAEVKARNMIEAARVLGVKDLTIQIKSNDQ